jgi:hypothetical protein
LNTPWHEHVHLGAEAARREKRRIASYLGLSDFEFGRELLMPFGDSIALKEDLVFLPMFDVKYGPTTVSWFSKHGESLSLIAARNKRAGIAFSMNL